MSYEEYDIVKSAHNLARICARFNLAMWDIEISEEDFEIEYAKNGCVGLLAAKKRAVRMTVDNGSYLN